jgi:hypothetical protein
MNRVTLGVAAFAAFAVAICVWLLTRSGTQAADGAAELPGIDPHAGLTFAEWSTRNDAALLADIDPGAGVSTEPRRFVVLMIARAPDGTAQVTDGPTFSWAAADRAASALALSNLGFRVSATDRAFVPPDDPLWSDPIERVDGATEQEVKMHSKSGGGSAHFTRHHGDPRSAPYWNRRAIGFGSSDGRFVYVTPDAIVIPAGARAP